MEGNTPSTPSSSTVPPPEQRQLYNVSEHPVTAWACDDHSSKQIVRKGELATVKLPSGCDTVYAEQFGALYAATPLTKDPHSRSGLIAFVTGGTLSMPLATSVQPSICFENLTSDTADLALPGGGFHRVQRSDSMDNKMCIAGLSIEVYYRNVLQGKGDVVGRAEVGEPGVWVTSSQLRYAPAAKREKQR